MSKNWVVTKINKKFFLRVGTKLFKCQIGKNGYKIYTKKQEGDQATPIGKWRLKSIYYRSDKVLRPKVKNKTGMKLKSPATSIVSPINVLKSPIVKFILEP